jgi:outer membrane protein OmpA-like peptidoglycan-associated protein
MKRFSSLIILAAMTLALAGAVRAQFADQGLGGGIGFGGTFGQTELRDRDCKFLGRAFLRYGLASQIQGEIGAGLGTVSGPLYRTQIVPVDYRFLVSPFNNESWNAYVYAGAGLLHYNIEVLPPTPTPGAETKGWSAFAPFGGGLQFMTNDNIAFEMSGGYNYMFSDNLNAVKVDANDGYWSFSIGLTAVGESPNADPDHDGLTNAQEKELGTNKKVADTDGDGLSDGEEVNTYKTNPLKDDSDGDGLKDGDEIKVYRTDPNKADTDGDGLSDSDEVNKYKTDPNKADTDGDGLSDGDEILKYKTDPVKGDTDGDGLSDGEEVNKRSTDPLKADTDGGSVNDGTEVNRGSNPLDPADDIKKEELVVEVGKAIVLDGVVFASGKSEITPESGVILEKAYNTLNQNPDITVEIQGHTDNTGKRSTNTKLSLARADAVKAWLVAKGIAETRITTKGFGPDKPIAPNTSVDGRQKNRRIEFFRVK